MPSFKLSSVCLMGLSFAAAIAVLSGCSGHAPTYTDSKGKVISYWDYRLSKICASDKLAINVDRDMMDTLTKLNTNTKDWVVRNVLVSDSMATRPANAERAMIYSQLPVQNTAAALLNGNARKDSTPNLMHVTLDCADRTATYFGPGVNSTTGVKGFIREPNDSRLDDLGDMTIRNLYISGGTDQGMPVNIHIYKDYVLATDTGGDQGQQLRAEEDEKFGIRKFQITIDQKTSAGKRELVIEQSVNQPNDTTVTVDSAVAANYLQVLPASYVAQVMMKSSSPQVKALAARLASRGTSAVAAELRSQGKAPFAIDFSVLDEARQQIAAKLSAPASGSSRDSAVIGQLSDSTSGLNSPIIGQPITPSKAAQQLQQLNSPPAPAIALPSK